MKGKKTKKNQSTSVKGEAIPLILSWGAVDLILDITWTMEELIDLELEWDNLNTLEDIRFLKEKKDLWSKFELSTTNPTLLTLLFLNKTSKKKSYIDYIPFGLPKFEGDDEYFSEVIKTVTEKNYLNINENALDENGRFSVIIKMHYEDKSKKIVVGTPKEGEAERIQPIYRYLRKNNRKMRQNLKTMRKEILLKRKKNKLIMQTMKRQINRKEKKRKRKNNKMKKQMLRIRKKKRKSQKKKENHQKNLHQVYPQRKRN